MDQSQQSYLIGPKAWKVQSGFRVTRDGLQQVPRKTTRQTLGSTPITAIVGIPVQNTVHMQLIALSDKVSFLKSNTTNAALNIVDSAGNSALASTDMVIGANDRWATTIYENRVYYTNPNCPIHVLDSSPKVARLNQTLLSAKNDYPSARYIETYYDHLFIADVNYRGRYVNRLQWSDLYNFHIWDSSRSNEADYYDILESDNALIGGATGLKRLGAELFTYTASGIYVTHYIGIALGVFRTDVLIPDVGNDFKYGLIGTERLHYFISERWENIFAFDGAHVQPFGDAIIGYFLDDLHTSKVFRQRTFGYVDSSKNEIVWAYVDKTSSGTHTKEIVFNLNFKKWYVRPCEGISAFYQGGSVGFASINLAGNCISLSGIIADLSPTANTVDKVWGTDTGTILTEDVSGSASLAQPLPYLETHDLTHSELSLVKEATSLFLQAGLGTAPTMQVYVSARQNVEDAVTYTLVAQEWVPTIREGLLSLPKTVGKILRYKFIPKVAASGSVDNVKWTMFKELIYGLAKAEK